MPDSITCTFCDIKTLKSQNLIYEDDLFYVKCDDFPIAKGHLLIVPKKHLSCIGEYDENHYQRFKLIYAALSEFLATNFESISSFEHGIFGQTIFHSHVHLLPFNGEPQDIVPEPGGYYAIDGMSDLHDKLKDDGGYLYFNVQNTMYLAIPSLRKPRFFRDRYAEVLRNNERKNWREVTNNTRLMQTMDLENQEIVRLWNQSLQKQHLENN